MQRKTRTLPLAALLLASAAQASTVVDTGEGWTDEYDQRQQAWEAAALESLRGMAPEALPPANDEAAAAAQPVPQPELSAQEALLGATAVPGNSTGPIQYKRCWYVASVGVLARPGFPMRWLLNVRRLPSQGCEQQMVTFDSSYASGPPHMIAVERQGLALAFPSKQSQWGGTHLRLYHVDPESLSVVRQTLLGSPTGGDTRAEEMSLEGNRLIIRGVKGGAIPGEQGSGNRFVATYPRFFTSELPPSIFAYPAPLFAVPVQQPGSDELSAQQQLLEEEGRLLEAAALEETRAALASASEPLPAEPTAEPERPLVEEGLTEMDALEYLRTHEPETLRTLVAQPQQVRGCWYFISARVEGWPPLETRVILTRMPSRSCKGQSVSLGTTYDRYVRYGEGIQAVAHQSQGIAVVYHQKWTPSGSGLVHTNVLAVDPKTLSITRSFLLGTYHGSTGLTGRAYFDTHNLIVHTNRYTAIFPRFLTSLERPLGVTFP